MGKGYPPLPRPNIVKQALLPVGLRIATTGIFHKICMLRDILHIPATEVVVREVGSTMEHISHIRHTRHIPATNVLVEGGG